MILWKVWLAFKERIYFWRMSILDSNGFHWKRNRYRAKFNEMRDSIWDFLCVFFDFVRCSIAARTVLYIGNHVFGNRLTKCFYIHRFLLRPTKVIAKNIHIFGALHSYFTVHYYFQYILLTPHKIIYIYDCSKHWLVSIANSFSWFLSSFGIDSSLLLLPPPPTSSSSLIQFNDSWIFGLVQSFQCIFTNFSSLFTSRNV